MSLALSQLDSILYQLNNKTFSNYDYQKISCFVNAKLAQISAEYDCKILFCAERSSHVWGTSHHQSDNDVKAIIYYKRRAYYSVTKQIKKSWKTIYGPRNTKQQLNFEKNVEEEEPDVELGCFELTKIGQMILKNDPTVFEIITSPFVYYRRTKEIMEELTNIIYSTYNWYKLAQHYVSWSRGNLKCISVRKKPLKILFVIWRNILSAEWLIKHQKCEGLPLFIPNLIQCSQLLSNEDKKDITNLLFSKLKESQFGIDCNQSQILLSRAQEETRTMERRLSDPKTNTQNIYNDKESTALMIDELLARVIENS